MRPLQFEFVHIVAWRTDVLPELAGVGPKDSLTTSSCKIGSLTTDSVPKYGSEHGAASLPVTPPLPAANNFVHRRRIRVVMQLRVKQYATNNTSAVP